MKFIFAKFMPKAFISNFTYPKGVLQTGKLPKLRAFVLQPYKLNRFKIDDISLFYCIMNTYFYEWKITTQKT